MANLNEMLSRTPLSLYLEARRIPDLRRPGFAGLRAGAGQFRRSSRQGQQRQRGLQVGGGYSENPYLARIAGRSYFDFGRDDEAPEGETKEARKKRLKRQRLKQKLSDTLNRAIEFQRDVRSTRHPEPHRYQPGT